MAHGDAVCQTAHRADCPFPQEMRYELPVSYTPLVPEAALSAEEAAPEAEVLSEAEPPQAASMAADIASAIERASAFFIFIFLLFV